MALSRRNILQAAAGGSALTVLAPASVVAHTPVRTVAFEGAGLYLYPAWGQPQPYLVVPTGPCLATLEFRDAATTLLLWTQSLSITGGFAGRLGGY